jgi:thymidine kinase
MEKPSGEIHVIEASVKGGKTSRLISVAVTRTFAPGNVIYVNHKNDTRSSTGMSSHSPLLKMAKVIDELSSHGVDFIQVSTFEELFSQVDIRQYGTVLIDEGQFWSDLRNSVLKISEEYGADVWVAGLVGCSNRKPFGEMSELLPIKTSWTVLNETLCDNCAKKGKKSHSLFSYRVQDRTGAQIQIGSDYMPVCRDCYKELTEKPGIGE